MLVSVNTIINHFFVKFRKSWKNGNGPIIFKLFWRTFAILRVSGKHPLTKDRLIISVKGSTIIGNLRTTTKFTTTTSVDWEKTGTRTSVSAGKRKLKMQSIDRSTTTTLNVNKQVEVVEL